jgi:uncharacterized protein (UPF0276 family)
MKLACNYCLEAERLLDEKTIDFDYFKYPAQGFDMKRMGNLEIFEEFCNKLTMKRPILLHGFYPSPHDLSSSTLQIDFNDEIANRLIKATKTPGLSVHPTLSKIPADVPFESIFPTIISNAKFLKEKFAYMDFMSLETLDHIDRWGDLLKPETTKRLLDETGCDYLLDISHAYYASRGLNIKFFDYLKMLPLEKTVEIHINGWVETEKGLMSHTKINDEAYEALREVLQYCKPQIITLEYGRPDDRVGAGCPIISPDMINNDAKNEIIEQITKIREIIHQ